MTLGFVAYIDESGDDGLRLVRPGSPGSNSEWFVLSCVLVRIERDSDVLSWVKGIVANHSKQRTYLHFRDLRENRKRAVCRVIADLPLRCFVVMSNKKNMSGYRNPRLVPQPNWFYWWVTRCLLEKVTDFCLHSSMRLYGAPRTVRIIFSRRGGLSYDDFRGYLRYLRLQSENKALYLKTGDLKWDVVDTEQVFAHDHSQMAGLQLTDSVASAFHQAVSVDNGATCQPESAKLLKPRIYRGNYGRFLGNGIKAMPAPPLMKLRLEQREIFEFYGFPKEKW